MSAEARAAGGPQPARGPATFDVCGDLPTGVTVLEASAGTGKTFTIAALAARYVAGGTPLDQLLLVTFGRMATGELRERVRDRLVTAEHGLARRLAGVDPPTDDEVLALLADADADEVALRRRRLAAALADFDAATIATTHGFCHHVLSGLGVAGDVETDVAFIEDPSDLVAEVVDDLYVRRFHWPDEPPPFDRAEALRIGSAAIANPLAPITPAEADPKSPPGMRRGLALAVRAELDRRKRRHKMLTYDDLLTRLAATLTDGVRGPDACARLRERYRIALVDEFQDTDPIQWDILRTAFGTNTTLVLIGDPKQAIYAFRGADVYAYLTAARDAGALATLDVNWRSDQGLIDAYDALFSGATLGHVGIAYRTVRAAEANQQPGLVDAPCPAPLRVRVVHRADGLVDLTDRGYVSKKSGESHVATDLAADVVDLLSSGAQIVTGERGGPEPATEPVRPRHIAVLVGTNKQAALMRDALDAVDVPAVINGAGSVFATPVAREWLELLSALERPASPTRARAVALSSFLGWGVEEVAVADERAWEEVHTRLHRWAAVLRTSGVASLLERITHTERLPGRLLGHLDGERQLTDLRHVGQLLHAEAAAESLGVTALTAWLRERIAEAATDTSSEERSRRLESDAEAVQVLTVHRSKGLEFPIVYHPFLWQPGYIPKAEQAIPVFHDPAAGDERTIDLAMGGRSAPAYLRYVEEERGEDLRLAYVALTRARHQAVVWWAGSWDARNAPLTRLLFARDDDGSVAAEGDGVPTDDEVRGCFEQLAARVPGRVSVERTGQADGVRWEGEAAEAADLGIRAFDREVDTGWRRTSYSRLTAAAREARVASEPEHPGVTDEPMPSPGAPVRTPAAAEEAQAEAEEARLRAAPSLLADMPAGAAIGTFVHAVLEHTDFAAADLDAELTARVGEQLAWRHLDAGDSNAVVAGLHAAIDTPLGPLVGETRLRDLTAAHRLDELDFELPLAGGETPEGGLTVSAIAELLRAHLPADDALAGYPDRLADPVLRAELRGYLSGSIDLVLRVHDADGTPRFAVADHKTNWLGPLDRPTADGEGLSAWHYRPVALAAAMQHAHYPLQGLLYTVALHRYLRWRLPGYDPERNLAGMLYLFLRGMTGAATPRVGDEPCGVFAWRPPTGLVVALSGLLDRGGVAA